MTLWHSPADILSSKAHIRSCISSRMEADSSFKRVEAVDMGHSNSTSAVEVDIENPNRLERLLSCTRNVIFRVRKGQILFLMYHYPTHFISNCKLQ